MTKVKPFFIKVITPLHVGSGSDLGVVDLPIQREAHTGFPKIEASSLKGSIRSSFTQENNEAEAEKIFGKDDNAGELGFSDAKILLFPVKSVKDVFAYITCPYIIDRFNIEIEEYKLPEVEELTISKSSKIDLKNGDIILEEYAFDVSKNDKVKQLSDSLTKITKIKNLEQKLVIIPNEEFTHFVKNSTEVITRITIDNEKGVVKKGGLFTEEYLPSETVMYALALGKVDKFTNDNPKVLQVGGNSTLGKGIVKLTIGVENGN